MKMPHAYGAEPMLGASMHKTLRRRVSRVATRATSVTCAARNMRRARHANVWPIRAFAEIQFLTASAGHLEANTLRDTGACQHRVLR